MMTDLNDSEIVIEKKPTIGERLSQARQARKITVGEVATELRLTKRIIELIENEQWGELHGRAYARGYFSNYVRFLGLPEDELLAAFNIEYRADEPSLLSVGTRHQIETSDKKLMWLPSLLFITVVVISWFVYQQIQNKAEDDITSLHANTFAEGTNSVEDTSKNYGVTQQDTIELEQLASTDTELSINSEQLNDSSSDNSGIEINHEVDATGLEGIDQGASNNDLIPEDSTVLLAHSALDLRFSGDCWVEVKDADNKVLLKKLMVKDDSIVLRGRAPLTVMLGRASAAQVRFNDELFDPSASTQKGVARFILGEKS